MILKKIYKLIKDKNIQECYDLIIEAEKSHNNNHLYWTLRGDLCNLILEYDIAISCYIKSLEIDSLNCNAVKRIISTYEILKDENNKKIYSNMLNQLEESFSDKKLLNLIASDFENVKLEYISDSFGFNKIDWYYLKNGKLIRNKEVISIDEYIIEELTHIPIIVPYNKEYVSNIRYLASLGMKTCLVAIQKRGIIYFVPIEDELIVKIKNKEYEKTITLNRLNAGDSNIYALCKYIPNRYKDKYNINIIEGYEAYNAESIVKVPLISSIAVSGHGTFLSYPYPELMYNIEVGHGPMSFKASGNMEKTYKEFAFTPREYANVDKMCASSTMDTILLASFINIPENRFLISGMPRTDTLLKTDGRTNLETILKMKINDKKVIFNMPTFHKHENSGKEDGNADLNSFMKVYDFDYKKFDEFLGGNELICVMKAHHAEESLLKSKEFEAENIFFIFNEDLERENLDLYEILNASDLLITDYSTIYSDFLFMNKPTVFVNTDIDEYRSKRGLALEPYEFWTAGPKVQNQQNLQNEIIKSLNDKDYYKLKREELRTVYHSKFDDKSSERVWDFIDAKLSKFI